MIKTLKDEYSLRLLCETLGMHRCNLYHEPRPDEDQPIKGALRELGGAWPTYGYCRLTMMLRREGLRVNEKSRLYPTHRRGIPIDHESRLTRSQASVFQSLIAYQTWEKHAESLEALRVTRPEALDLEHIKIK